MPEPEDDQVLEPSADPNADPNAEDPFEALPEDDDGAVGADGPWEGDKTEPEPASEAQPQPQPQTQGELLTREEVDRIVQESVAKAQAEWRSALESEGTTELPAAGPSITDETGIYELFSEVSTVGELKRAIGIASISQEIAAAKVAGEKGQLLAEFKSTCESFGVPEDIMAPVLNNLSAMPDSEVATFRASGSQAILAKALAYEALQAGRGPSQQQAPKVHRGGTGVGARQGVKITKEDQAVAAIFSKASGRKIDPTVFSKG